MKRTIAIDLPALYEGDRHGVDMALLHDALRSMALLKNLEIVLNRSDLALLAGNPDFAFSSEVWKFLSEVTVDEYGLTDWKENLLHSPNIIDAGFTQEMKNAIYLQLCVIHGKGLSYDTVIFVGFIPRFTKSFQLETIRDKKTRAHHTELFSKQDELNGWINRCRPHLDQKKHGAKEKGSEMGKVAPFTSYFKIGVQYAEELLQKAYMESQDEAEFPHYLYTWDAEAGTFIEFRHENHDGDSQHNYHGMDMVPQDYQKVPKHIRMKYHR